MVKLIQKTYKSLVNSITLEIELENIENSNLNKTLQALVDTGSNLSYVDVELAKCLNLESVGTINVNTANGYVTGIVYIVNLHIQEESFKDFIIVALPKVKETILLGMNFLRLGDTHIKTSSGYTEFQFERN